MTFDTLKAKYADSNGISQQLGNGKQEHRMHHWMDAYGDWLGAKEAQVKVKKV